MLRVVYGVLKNRKPYDLATDEQFELRAREKQLEIEADNKRQKKEQTVSLERCNDAESAASPISKRHAKKRKQLETS
jgi:hypothetical protein